MNAPLSAIQVHDLAHYYGRRQALRGLDLEIERGAIFAVLGPNGGGKTTLFRILSTLLPVQQGRVCILGYDAASQTPEIRRRIGVVFQAPSLDAKLTVLENVRHQAALYGLYGSLRRQREDSLLQQFGLADRRHDLAETLSGGMKRRVELAKGLIHRPQLLLLDEPSTGLDPGARSDLWEYLCRLRRESGVTVVLTTHLLEEAERADRIAILHEGSLVACGTPEALRATVGGDSITIETHDPQTLADAIRQRFDVSARVMDGRVRLEQQEGHRWVARLVEAFADRIDAITVGKPSLEDVFIDRTGRRFWSDTDGHRSPGGSSAG
jgi:ABC-2 type transport system ATP-binding protein